MTCRVWKEHFDKKYDKIPPKITEELGAKLEGKALRERPKVRIDITPEDLKRSLAKVKMKSSPSISGMS